MSPIRSLSLASTIIVTMIAAMPAVAAPVVVDVDLPSASTGGGTLALRLFAPGSAAEARFPEGAPVIVKAEGGSSPGNLDEVMFRATDMVRIVFLFPGGTDQATGRKSDGTYDFRGPSCIAALRDVVLFAAGELADANGATIDELVPAPVVHGNVGLIGTSQGGNIVTVVAAQHGASLAVALRYVVQWESPVLSQVSGAEVGGAQQDCPGGGRHGVRDTNPRYRGYATPDLDVDYAQLRHDPGSQEHLIYWDGNGDGSYTTVLDPATGCASPDLDLDGDLTLLEDFPMAGAHDGTRHVYSRAATRAFEAMDLFGCSTCWPAGIATVAEADAAWDLREGASATGEAVAAVPGLEGMVIASVEDHVQIAVDHPHIRGAFEAWDATGAWVKLNPSPAYDVAADPGLGGRTDLPDNTPNAAPGDWSQPEPYFPEDVSTDISLVAGVWEMADRAQSRPPAALSFVTGQGLALANPNRVRVHDPSGAATGVDFHAFAAGKWGVNVAAADLDGASAEILAGPGPGEVFGPQVRAFTSSGASMPGVSFFAYGTLRYGVNVAGTDPDGDGFAEILTGPGPGAVFGPHVRGWNHDGGALTPIARIGFFAYGTLRYGVNVAGGDVDGDAFREILTAPGPGATFGPQVRGFDDDGAGVDDIAGINFQAFSVPQYGASVAGGDVDADGFAEIAAAPGPGAGGSFPARFKGFDHDGGAVVIALPGFDVTPFPTSYGGRVGLGHVGGGAGDELLAGAGPDPAADSTVEALAYDAGVLAELVAFVPFGTSTYGVNVAAGALGP